MYSIHIPILYTDIHHTLYFYTHQLHLYITFHILCYSSLPIYSMFNFVHITSSYCTIHDKKKFTRLHRPTTFTITHRRQFCTILHITSCYNSRFYKTLTCISHRSHFTNYTLLQFTLLCDFTTITINSFKISRFCSHTYTYHYTFLIRT